MKKVFLTPILLLAFAFTVLAQSKDSAATDLAMLKQVVLKSESKFSLNVHAGYAFGLGSTFKYYPDDVTSIQMMQVANGRPTKSVTYSSPTSGLGQGFRFGAGVSYIVNDFINVGMDMDYFKSTISKTKDSTFSQTNIVGGLNGMDSYSYNERNKISYDATLLTFSPNITFKAISRPKWYLYNKLGAVITFRPNSTQQDIQTTNVKVGWQGFVRDSASYNTKTYDWGIKNPAFGFMGGVGAQFKLTNKIRVYGELQFSHIVFVVRSRTITNFMVNGEDKLATLPLNQREVQYSSSFTDNQTSDPNSPARAITERIPITYLGFQTGFSFRL